MDLRLGVDQVVEHLPKLISHQRSKLKIIKKKKTLNRHLNGGGISTEGPQTNKTVITGENDKQKSTTNITENCPKCIEKMTGDLLQDNSNISASSERL
jgi:hypothetical protein